MYGNLKYTYAITNVGAGSDAYQSAMGELFSLILDTLQECATTLDIDIVVCCWDQVNFNMLQSLRAQRGLKEYFPLLTEHKLFLKQKKQAEKLVDLAAVGKLAIFAGAGISLGSGLPSWSQLLDQLALKVKPPIQPDDEEWQNMDLLSKADLIKKRLHGTEKSLVDHIVDLFDEFEKPSYVHYLLASLPCTEYVTTNYDQLLEVALTSSDKCPNDISVLPQKPKFDADTWVLKMHGDVGDRNSIVLTREDYLRYEERASALGGIVQAKMMTSHILFVGFSLSDDNFFKIADTVKKSLPEDKTFGTSLQLQNTPLQSEIWKNQLDFVNFSESKAPHIPYSARRLAIWLDYLNARTSSENTPIMDTRFESVCTPAQNELRKAIVQLESSLSVDARNTLEYQRVAKVIDELRPFPQSKNFCPP